LEEKFSFKPYIIFTLLSIIILLFEGSFLSIVFVGGMIPDLLLIVVVCLAFLWGEKKAIVLGLICGFLQDLFFGPAIGFFTFAKILSAYFSGISSREIYKDQIVGPMLTVFLATFVHEFIVFFLLWVTGWSKISFFYALDQVFLPRALYHLALTLLIYPLIYRAEKIQFFNFFLR